MKTTLLPILLTLLAQSTAWVFVYRNASNDATSTHSLEERPCQKIDQSAGHEFQWDAQGGPWCIYLYKDSNCTEGGGWECNGRDWQADSSTNLLSFEVQHRPPGYSDPALSTSATASPTAAPNATITITSTPVPVNGRKPLSDGGIAGVVIGVVAGVVLFAILGFFLGRKRGRAQGGNAITGADEQGNSNTGLQNGAAVAAAAAEENKDATSPMSQTQIVSPESPPVQAAEQTYRPPGSRMVELVGNNGTSELSDSNRVMELEGNSVKPHV
ncbi:hypothetical protein PHISCL_06548 [Aspergillus sclerotialis]|uniref:Uncharacterized protein n=1 Tax=Aspergillus sclerotialis TaxID=2070753 RepID=A0A3A2ZP03_9EURO|nr:hypothetical protein PHISCL_06548 [Aspergillus sclerotialis]